MSEKTTIDYSYQLTYAHRIAITLAELKRAGWPGWFFRWGFYICVVVALTIEVILVRYLYPAPQSLRCANCLILLGGVWTVAAIFVALSVNCAIQKILWRTMAGGYSLRHASLSADGVIEKSGTRESKCLWTDINGVESTSQLTLLLLGEGSAYVVPHDALPSGLTIEKFLESIAEWREAAS